MATKRKISELPECRDFHGLKTIGTDANNNSVAVSLSYLQEVSDGMKDATAKTIKATEDANKAATNANNSLKDIETTEKEIVAAEKERVLNEQARQTAEETRASNEQTRINNEDTRKTAEQSRESAEKERVANETSRLEAESAREKSESQREQNADELCQKVKAALQLLEFNVPAELVVENPGVLAAGGADVQIKAHLLPKSVVQNILFLGDDNAVSVSPTGLIKINKFGESVIYVIPTNRVELWQKLRVVVRQPYLRLSESGGIRLTEGNRLRIG